MPVIPATQEVEIGGIKVLGQLGQKVSKTLSQQISLAWWPVNVISRYMGSINRVEGLY
jgi:hypothetical protein